MPFRSESILCAISDYYAAKIAAHGATPQGVDWKDHDLQRLRHRQFLRLLGDDHGGSIADVGCGYGDFLTFLRESGYTGSYTGYDLAAEMIEAARAAHGAGPDRDWIVSGKTFDAASYVIASGIFNVKQGYALAEWEQYIDQTVEQMASAAQRGFGFNVLSMHSDPARRREYLYYADPVVWLDRIAKRYGRHVALLQDYGLFEFTVLVRCG